MDSYIIILKNYESLYIFQTKEYNEDVIKLLNWYIGSRHDVVSVFKNAEPIITNGHDFVTKEDVKRELKWKKSSYFFDEEDEELDEKISMLLNAF